MESFEVTKKDHDDIVVLYIKGYLDAHTAPVLENQLQSLIEEQRYKIVVNFKDLAYISSAGLGVFMGFIENIREHQGDIKLTNMNPKIYRVFDLLGFPTIYDILEDEQQAIVKFAR
ncbi:MAG: STAS domain-containing protein [candidate division KSB1 bacterium]|nr:STAS domain-containing protein [candidate division KSB1 bacterium]